MACESALSTVEQLVFIDSSSYCQTVYEAKQRPPMSSVTFGRYFVIDPSRVDIVMPNVRRITYIPWYQCPEKE